MKGLLAKEDQGRHGDSLLVHIRPDELPAIQDALGSKGTRNPKTGFLEFWTGEGDTDNGAGPGVGVNDGPGTASPTEAPDTSISVNTVPGTTPGVTSQGTAPASGPSIAEQVMAMLNITPAGMARTGLGLMMGPMSPGIAHGIAQGVGNVAHALGATNEGAAAAQSAVGMGGPQGDAGQNGGDAGYTDPIMPPIEPPPLPVIPPPSAAPPPPPGLLAIGGTRRPYGVQLQSPNLPRGLLG